MFGKKFFLALLLIVLPLMVLVNFDHFSSVITQLIGRESQALVTSTRISTFKYRCNKNETCSRTDRILMAQTLDKEKNNLEIEVRGDSFSKIKSGDVITYLQLDGYDPVLKNDSSLALMMIVAQAMGMAFFIFLGIYFARNEAKLRKVRDNIFK